MNKKLSIAILFSSLLTAYTVNGSVSPVMHSHVLDMRLETSVELGSFEVNDMETKVALSWATITEKNANHIFVERSVDGKKWISVSKIKAAENSTNTQYYEFYDESPLKGISYYRLRIEGLEGGLEFSETKTVERNKELFVIVYPNTAAGLLNLASSYNVNDMVFELFDKEGKQVPIVAELVSDEKMVLDVADLPKGVYTVNVKSLDGKALNTQKVTLK